MSIYLDLNARVPAVTTSLDVMIEDTKVIVQSVLRLITTEEGEIPNYRSYGLNLKQFSQYPLTKQTASMIAKYTEDKVRAYEQRVDILNTLMEADYINSAINMKMVLRIKSTREIVQLPAIAVNVAA